MCVYIHSFIHTLTLLSTTSEAIDRLKVTHHILSDLLYVYKVDQYIYILYILQPKHRYSLLSQKKWNSFVENSIFYYGKVIPGKVMFKNSLCH